MKTINIAVKGNYSDELGNIIEAPNNLNNITVCFSGTHNRLIISADSKIHDLNFDFPSHNATTIIGKNGNLCGQIRTGYLCTTNIGDNVTCTNRIYITSAESTTIIIGDDCMFATGNQIRSDDAHAIYDINSGNRINKSKNITIGEHVWLAYNAVVLSGAQIGEGSVVGFNSIAKNRYPNNCIIAGSPAKVVKKDIAWERPHVMLNEPWIRDSVEDIVPKIEYWNLTDIERPIYPGQGIFHNLYKLSPIESYIDKNNLTPYVKLMNLSIHNNRIYPKGISIIKGLPCPEYTPTIKNYLVFISESDRYSKKLAKFSYPNISRKLFDGRYLSYDKGMFLSFKSEGMLIDDIPEGKYKLGIILTYNDLDFYVDLESDSFVEEINKSDTGLILKLYSVDKIIYFEKTNN